ncbi:MAG: GldG family protein [Oligoflexia bacterium]|nr:GldG family protein [Oligoflexia bacterium]
MTRWYRFTGILGLVLFLFGIGGGLVLESFTQPLMLAHLLAGTILLITWFFLVGVRTAGQAGAVVRGRTVRYGTNAILYSVVFVGLLSVLNWWVNRHDKRWDLTESGVYSLSPQSVSVVQGLKRPLKIVGVGDTQAADDSQMKELFELYEYHNPKLVKAEVISPRTKPQLIDTYGIKPGNLVYIEYGDGEAKGVSRLNEFSEEAITNGILKLTRGEAKKVYYVSGHDEPSITRDGVQGLKLFAEGIADEHLKVESILLSKNSAVPDDAAAVILAAPKKALLPQERDMLKAYVEKGGRLLMFNDPRTTSDIKDLAAQFGIQVGDDVIIDQVQRLFDAPALGAQPVITSFDTHPITRSFTPETVVIFNIASSVKATGQTDANTNYSDLAKTGPTAWGEKNLSLVFDSTEPTATLDKDDVAGPVSVAVAYEKRLSAKPEGEAEKDESRSSSDFDKVARVVVFGDSDFIQNQNLRVYNNRDFALNAVNWLVGEEGGLTIRAKSMRASVAPIPRDTFMMILASSFVLPELLLVLGLFIWWKRRTADA